MYDFSRERTQGTKEGINSVEMNEQITDLEFQAVLDAAKRGDDGLPGPHEVLDAIDQWRELDLRGSSAETISAEFHKLFPRMINAVTSTTLSAPRSFYRIRRSSLILSSIDDFWAPSVERAKKGRCGFDGLPMLYLSEDGMAPFEELGIPLHEHVYIAKYNIKPGEALDLRYPFVLRSDGGATELSEERLLAERIMREFVRSEFLRPVGQGTEFLYNLTASICWFIRTHMHGHADGISYPSIVHGSHRNNVALYPNAQTKVEIEDLRIVELVNEHEWHDEKRVLTSHFHPGFDGNTRFVNCYSKGVINGEVVAWEPCVELGAF